MEVTRLTEITAPSVEPVTLDDAKRWARIDSGVFNADITNLIVAARKRVETITRRALITQVWEYKLDAFPEEIRVPLPPLQKVNSIKYYDTDGVLQTLSNTLYSVDTDSEKARIQPAYGEVWPSTRGIMNAVVVNFDAGYGGAATDVPEPIVTAIKILVTHYFQNPELVGPLVKTTPESVQALLATYRILSEF